MTSHIVHHSHQVLNEHARTFSLASRMLPAHIRDNVAVTYAFCRLVDDTVDDAPSQDAAARGLAKIQSELDGSKQPRALIQCFRQLCQEHGVPQGAVHELTVGVGSDLGTIRFESDRDLLRYSYRVAGTVGLMMARLIGATAPEAMPYAVDLGVAMQITNICRDVLEDARRDRVYLPAKRLAAQGISQEMLVNGDADRAALGRVVSDLLMLADQYYDSGSAGMHFIPSIPRSAIASAARMYRAIGLEIERRHYNVLSGRAVVPPQEKLKWFTRGLGFSMLCPLADRKPHQPYLHRHFDGFAGVNYSN